MQYDTGGAVGVEQPAKRDSEHPVMYERDDFAALLKHCPFKAVDVDQCMFGGEAQKPMTLIFYGMDLEPMAAACNHPVEWHWFKPVAGDKP